MRRGWLGTVVVALVAVTPAGPAHALTGAKQRVTCSSGPTIIRDGRLKIIGIGIPNRYGPDEATLYACLGHRRPRVIGDEDVDFLVFDGARYYAALNIQTGGEGAADGTHYVGNLRTGRDVSYLNALLDDDLTVEPFRVTAGGALVRDDYGIQVVRPGYRGDRGPRAIGSGHEIAYVGNTIYWTERLADDSEVARSAAVDAPARTRENRLYDFRAFDAHRLLHPRRGRCASLPGTTIAASVGLRVVAQRTRTGRTVRYACALKRAWVRSLGPLAGPRGELRIVSDRWLLSRTGGGATLLDGRNGEVVTRVADAGITAWTLAGNGTLAWIGSDGRLLGQAPRAAAPTVLAEAAAAPTALASSDATIYWTSAGAPGRWQR
jgi:hypothetical protein